MSTACYISAYMHSHVSCSRRIRHVNKSRLSERIKFGGVKLGAFIKKMDTVDTLIRVNISQLFSVYIFGGKFEAGIGKRP